MKTTTKNRRRNDRFFKLVFKMVVVSLTIVNDDPTLTIGNDDSSLRTVNVKKDRYDDPSFKNYSF